MWIWLLAGGVVVVSLVAGGGAKVRRGPRVKVAGPGDGPPVTVGEIGEVIVGQVGSWVCKRGDKIPIPSPSSILPAQLINANVILTAVEAMIGALRAIVDGLGFGTYRCAVMHGQTIYLAQVRGPCVKIVVTAELGYKKRESAVYGWRFQSDDVSSTGEIPSTIYGIGKHATYTSGEREHLRNGTQTPWSPPKSACNTVCIGGPGVRWLELPESMRMPHVWILRTGEDIRVWIYIPPRSGYYKSLDVHGQGTRDDDVQWMINYEIGKV